MNAATLKPPGYQIWWTTPEGQAMPTVIPEQSFDPALAVAAKSLCRTSDRRCHGIVIEVRGNHFYG